MKRMFQPTKKSARLWLATAMLLSIQLGAVHAQSVRDGFDPDADGPVLVTVVQPDGKILIGGNFSQLSPNGESSLKRSGIARLNPDGNVDLTFTTVANGPVRAIAVQPDGKILIGGDFTLLTPSGAPVVPRNRIARLNADGTVDPAFNPNANGPVRALTMHPGGRILVGGIFTNIGGATRANIARLNPGGSADAFDPNANGTVNAIAVDANGILVGGAFTRIGGALRNNIARLNGAGAADSFDPNATSSVFAIAIEADGNVLVGGTFTSIGGLPRIRLARLLGATGGADGYFRPDPNADVYTIAIQADGRILAGGAFTTIGRSTRNAIARLEPNRGIADGLNSSSNGQVFSIAVQQDTKMVACGDFTSIKGLTRNRIARFEFDGSLEQSFIPLLDSGSRASTVALQTDGKVLVGGLFGRDSTPFLNVARMRLDGSIDAAFASRAATTVGTIAVQPDGDVLAGGFFNSLSGDISIGGQLRNFIARLDGATGLADPFNPNADNPVSAITVLADGKILVAGSFRRIGGVSRRYLARLDPVTGVPDSFNPNPNAPIHSLVVQPDGKILVSGDFTQISGVPRSKIARLDPVTGAADAFNGGADGAVHCIALQADGKVLAGGVFTEIAGTQRRFFVRLNQDGTLDSAFNPAANEEVTSIVMQSDGKLVVSGRFTAIGGAPRRIARLDPATGAADSFNPPMSGQLLGLAIQTDGKILSVGNFAIPGGPSEPFRLFAARLSNDTAALQNLAVTSSNITWTRAGSSPQFTRTTFETSTDNLRFTFLGNGTQSGSNWVLTGLSLPAGENTIIRARGYYRSGANNGSESVLGFRQNTFLSPGRFVIGDRNAVVGQRVVFWGPQWTNWNVLSGGPAPSSFKGFADLAGSAVPDCGATWNTELGHHPAPPRKLPETVEVIVASSISKSGGRISGDVNSTAIVRVDPGYDGNSGNIGTGTVLSVSCAGE